MYLHLLCMYNSDNLILKSDSWSMRLFMKKAVIGAISDLEDKRS